MNGSPTTLRRFFVGSFACAAVAMALRGVLLIVPASGAGLLAPLIEFVPVMLLLGSVVLLAIAYRCFARRSEAIMASEREQREYLEIAYDTILRVDRDRRIIAVTRHNTLPWGWSAEELVGKPLASLLPEWSPERNAAPPELSTLARALDGEGAVEFVARAKDRSLRAVETRCCPVPDGPPGALVLYLRDVTRSRQTREELRAKEAHLRLVVEQMPAILWTTDAQLNVTSTSGGGLAALEIDSAELIGISLMECLGKNDLESTPVAAHMEALRGGSISYEMDWKERTFQVRVDPLRDRKKRIAGTIGVVVDVTDQKQTMAELKARVRQQEVVAAVGKQALAGADLGSVLTEACRAVREALDVDCAEVLELQPDARALRVRAADGWVNPHRASVPSGRGSLAGFTVLAGEPVVSEDLRTEERFHASTLVKEHGLVSSLSVLVPGPGRPFGVVSVHARVARAFSAEDRTFLQAVANVLATAIERREAEEARGRLVAILEATTDCVAIAGADQKLRYLNRAGRAMLGLTDAADVAGLALPDFCHGDQRARFQGDALPTAITRGSWAGEIDLHSRAGRVVTVSQVVLAHRAADGALEFLSTIARDVTEQRALEDQLRQAQKMEAVGRLAGGIAHDFNNLLCIMNGYCEMILARNPQGDELRGYLTEIDKAGVRAANLTRQLLAFSRKQIMTPKVLDLNALIADMQKLLRRLIGEDIELATQPGAGLFRIKADPGQLEQVLLNLAVNARDAMPTGGTLTVSTANLELDEDTVREDPDIKPGAYVQLTVCDTGVGMDESIKARIFEPFFTTKEVGKGTGLGLATVYGIVKQSGGHITVESALGRGATFRVLLPRADAEVLVAAKAASDPGRGTETILVVEDEDAVRALVLNVLRGRGYTVLEARDGEEALSVCASHAGIIDLMISDVVMPRMSGGRLFRRVHRAHPETRVLFMSGFTDSTLVRHEVVNGEVECLLKPFSPDELAHKVRETLKRPPPVPRAPAPAAVCGS